MDNNTKTKPEEASPILEEEVAAESPLKEIFIDYVGNKKKPEDDKVTVDMIVETLAEEFPEFLMAVAEENWIRGYHQALSDVEEGEKIYEEINNPEDEEQSGEISIDDSDAEEIVSD
jgi:hypothetical protein